MGNLASHDVFISFQGGDDILSSNFNANLWKALSDREIYPTNGFCLEYPQLINVIQESRISIIVLTENYAVYSFRLEELALIVDNFQQNHVNRFIFPVFYNIDPFHVRNQSGPYREAFEYHEERLGENNQRVRRWRSALSIVGRLPGWQFNHRHRSFLSLVARFFTWNFGRRDWNEIRLIDQIVEEVSRKLGHFPFNSATRQRVSNANRMWRPFKFFLYGLVSSVIVMLYYALSPSFIRLIGRWKPFTFFLYGLLALAIFTTALIANQSSLTTRLDQLKTYMSSKVMMIMAVYSYFYDRVVNPNREILSVVLNIAFALVLLGLHKLINFGFEIGVFSSFLGCFAVPLFTIISMLIFVAIFYLAVHSLSCIRL